MFFELKEFVAMVSLGNTYNEDACKSLGAAYYNFLTNNTPPLNTPNSHLFRSRNRSYLSLDSRCSFASCFPPFYVLLPSRYQQLNAEHHEYGPYTQTNKA